MRRIFSKILLTLLFCLFISSGSIFAAQTVTFNYNVTGITNPNMYRYEGNKYIYAFPNSPNDRLQIMFQVTLLGEDNKPLNASYEVKTPQGYSFGGYGGELHHDSQGYLRDDKGYDLTLDSPMMKNETDSDTFQLVLTGLDENGNPIEIDRIEYLVYPDFNYYFDNTDGYSNRSNGFEKVQNSYYDCSFKYKKQEVISDLSSDPVPVTVNLPTKLVNKDGKDLKRDYSAVFEIEDIKIASGMPLTLKEPRTQEVIYKDGIGTLSFSYPFIHSGTYKYYVHFIKPDLEDIEIQPTSKNADAGFTIDLNKDKNKVTISYDDTGDQGPIDNPNVLILTKNETPVEGITLNSNKLNLKVGQTSQLQATINPTNATEKEITWNSSNPEIVEVDQNGKLIAKTEGNAKITAISSVYPSISATCDVTVTKTEETKPTPQTQNVHVVYSGHIQDIGWSGNVKDGEPAGTTGQAKRLEAIKINLVDDNNQPINGLGIQYKGHVQNIGWQSYVSNGAICGTEGKAYRVEALQVQLTGSKANDYDVFYRTHVQNIGWTGWTKNNAKSGSEGLAYQVESIEIKVLPKNDPNSPTTLEPAFYTKQGAEPNAGSASGLITVASHIQDIGWQNPVSEGSISGTTGQNKKVECIKINKVNNISGDIETSVKVQEEPNWRDYVGSGKEAGTTGRNLRMDGIKIRLTGELAQKYDVAYRSHIQDIGWESGWKTNDQASGAVGQNKKIEAIEVMLVPKGTQLPNV